MKYKLGIDLGGTKIEGVALDPDGKEVFRKRIPTEREKGYGHILEGIRSIYGGLVKEIHGRGHTLGIGTPGAVSYRTGSLKNSNTVCLNKQPLREDLQRILGRNFQMENDANCFALAEALWGAGMGKDLVFGVIMGTGCGGGIVYQGKPIRGLQGIAGEWGHSSMDPRGPECYCGKRGCVETFISGGVLEKRFEKETGNRLSFKEIAAMSRAGDPAAVSFLQTFLTHFGRALANLINILDPDVIVLGGGLSNMEELYAGGVAAVRGFVFSDSLETPIVKNKLGDSAGVIGAALIGI